MRGLCKLQEDERARPLLTLFTFECFPLLSDLEQQGQNSNGGQKYKTLLVSLHTSLLATQRFCSSFPGQ